MIFRRRFIMRNKFKILSLITYLIGMTLSANPNDAFINFDKRINKANEDFGSFFRELRKQNIIPKEFKLSPENMLQNNIVLRSLFEAIKQNPQLSPENNQHIKTLLEKIEKLNYLELRRFIGSLQTNEKSNSKPIITLTEQDKSNVLSTLHSLYKFKVPTQTAQSSNYPFRQIIRDIFIYISYLSNSSNIKTSYENKRAMLALFLDKTNQQILKVKAAYPSCTIKTEDLNLLLNILKSYSLNKSILKKVIIGTSIATIALIMITILTICNRKMLKCALTQPLQTFEIFVQRLTANFLNQLQSAGLGARVAGYFIQNQIPVPEYQ